MGAFILQFPVNPQQTKPFRAISPLLSDSKSVTSVYPLDALNQFIEISPNKSTSPKNAELVLVETVDPPISKEHVLGLAP